MRKVAISRRPRSTTAATASSAGASLLSCLITTRVCASANTTVSGMKPKDLKATQTSVVCVRQTASLRIARNRKKNAQRQVRMRQPSAVSCRAPSNMICRIGRRNASAEQQGAGEQAVEHRRLDLDEGLVLEIQRQRAEDDDDDRRHHRHDRQPAQLCVGDDERDQHGDHHHAGGDVDLELPVDEKEQRERAELQRELQLGVEFRAWPRAWRS